jgi:hypothetical protein
MSFYTSNCPLGQYGSGMISVRISAPPTFKKIQKGLVMLASRTCDLLSDSDDMPDE